LEREGRVTRAQEFKDSLGSEAQPQKEKQNKTKNFKGGVIWILRTPNTSSHAKEEIAKKALCLLLSLSEEDTDRSSEVHGPDPWKGGRKERED
jgi:hypothetical protein